MRTNKFKNICAVNCKVRQTVYKLGLGVQWIIVLNLTNQ